jgi:hypothetical protein
MTFDARAHLITHAAALAAQDGVLATAIHVRAAADAATLAILQARDALMAEPGLIVPAGSEVVPAVPADQRPPGITFSVGQPAASKADGGPSGVVVEIGDAGVTLEWEGETGPVRSTFPPENLRAL